MPFGYETSRSPIRSAVAVLLYFGLACYFAGNCPNAWSQHATEPPVKQRPGVEGAGAPGKITGFTLPATTGDLVVFPGDAPSKLTVICFLGTECPLVRLYAPVLSKLSIDYADQGVRFIGVNSNRQDSIDDLRKFVKQYSVNFQLVQDSGNQVADQFGAQRTPEVFVIDGKLRIRYRGRIDNQFTPGVARSQATDHFLVDALDQLLAGKTPRITETKPAGCIIGRLKTAQANAKVTFANQVSRVFQKHCVECHRGGEIGPFSLSDYDEAVGWAEMVVEVVDDGRMPPWHAHPDYGEFVNARVMPEVDKQTLRDWFAQGMAFGDEAELPAPRRFTAGWRLPREPDLVVTMRDTPLGVPATGTVEYQYFVVDPGFKTDRWVTAAQVIPGNRSVVHHSIVFIRPPDGSAFRGVGWLAAYVPGQGAPVIRPGHARKIPAGSKFVFQQHYTPIGKPQNDATRIGILFVDDNQVTHEVFTLAALDQEFEIPPHEPAFQVQANLRQIPKYASLLSVAPHMHYRGKSFELEVHQGQQVQRILQIPNYDFNWQHIYTLAKPLSLEDVDQISFTALFDNSSDNPFNPDPGQGVSWGDQTWEEMAVAFFNVAQSREAQAIVTDPLQNPRTQLDDPPSPDQWKVLEAKAKPHVDRYFGRLDSNGDGRITLEEMPNSIKRFGVWQIDRDGDNVITRDEFVWALLDRGKITLDHSKSHQKR